MNSKEIIKKIEADGWKHVRMRGSHRHFKHDEKPGVVTVTHPVKDVSIGVIKSIEKMTNIKLK